MHRAVHISEFGRTPDGVRVDVVRLSSESGVSAQILTFGATLQSFRTPDASGIVEDIVLGHDDLGPYIEQRNYFGSTVGRYANRIAGGRFSIGVEHYSLDQNDGPHCLHGGHAGFDKQVWALVETGARSATLRHISRDGDGGFPGAVTVDVTYTLSDEGALIVDYLALADQDTVLNLTNHSYFNLDFRSGDTLNHRVQIDATSYLPVDDEGIPVGGLASVTSTPFDLRRPTIVGHGVRALADRNCDRAGGFDHSFALNGGGPGKLHPVARLATPSNGRTLELSTTQAALHFYSGNFLDGTTIGRGGRRYHKHDGLCLEPQCFPDTPNQPRLGSAVLRQGQVYTQTSIFRPGVS